MPRLTKRHIDVLPAREKECFVWDDQLKGFGARVYPNGGKRYFAQTFRRGKTVRVQIGRHGALSFDEAKARARKIIADIAESRNPNKEKEAERLSPTMAELAERFLKEYVPDHCKPRTRVEYRHAVERYILLALGSIKVTAFRLLLYTGARLSEIQTLKWEHIRGHRIHLPDSMTGATMIPLNGPALEVLAGTKRVEGNPYVITGSAVGAHPSPDRRHHVRDPCRGDADEGLGLGGQDP